jgi:hypothetical protein
MGTIADRTALGNVVKMNDWNQTSSSERRTFSTSSTAVMAVMIDDDPTSSNQLGMFGIEIEGRRRCRCGTSGSEDQLKSFAFCRAVAVPPRARDRHDHAEDQGGDNPRRPRLESREAEVARASGAAPRE